MPCRGGSLCEYVGWVDTRGIELIIVQHKPTDVKIEVGVAAATGIQS